MYNSKSSVTIEGLKKKTITKKLLFLFVKPLTIFLQYGDVPVKTSYNQGQGVKENEKPSWLK